MESVEISPKKCKIAMALAGHHTGRASMNIIELRQGHPTTVFCKISGEAISIT